MRGKSTVQNKALMLVLSCLLAGVKCPAQGARSPLSLAGKSYEDLQKLASPEKNLRLFHVAQYPNLEWPLPENLTNSTPANLYSETINPLFEIKNAPLPFFCKIEHQLSLKTALPFKFRLGSVEYVDWLESKPGCSSYLPR